LHDFFRVASVVQEQSSQRDESGVVVAEGELERRGWFGS